ncbi:hypothetical protein LJR129_004950 [Acidovorax sp. LjRoot129]|uniref:hypothetical protein n=1 Tax=unclassified Acidovorax TaxID=2684926 RepID=UPI003ECF4722
MTNLHIMPNDASASRADPELLKLTAKASGFTNFPVGLVLLLVLVGAGFISLSIAGFLGVFTEPRMDQINAAILGALGLCALFFGCILVADFLAEIEEDGIDLVNNFSFNEAGRCYLRTLMATRSKLRNCDVAEALSRHFKREIEVEQEALRRRREESIARLKAQG